ncbi:MAG: DUF3500 domain-containing protein [Candidatus Eisenbacteria bacterium]|nr:DUF3500 domain-containing protein [Candidatus Eisenbacteria bacterium]
MWNRMRALLMLLLVALLLPSQAAASLQDVVDAADDFKALLSTSQINELEQPFTESLAEKWSNLPCGSSCRNGLGFGDLDDEQLEAAKAVIRTAAGTALSEGYSEFWQVVTADSLLGTVAGNNYSKDLYFISFLNSPSTSSPWMLQYGGHHIAVNIAYNGATIGGTPMFVGVEPTSWTNGLATATLENEHDALAAMLAGLSASELSQAALSGSFSDVVLGPGRDGEFPLTPSGIACSNLTASQQELVLTAMDFYLDDLDAESAAWLRGIYESELADTYIGYKGTGTSGVPSSFLASHADYVRIDGPSVWIEFVCQNGVVFNQIHYHSVWRDEERDYGDYLTATTSIDEDPVDSSSQSVLALSNYPNPFRSATTVAFTLREEANVRLDVFDPSGKKVETLASNVLSPGAHAVEWNASDVPGGVYFCRLQAGSEVVTQRMLVVR